MLDYGVLRRMRPTSFPYFAGHTKIIGRLQMEKEEPHRWWLKWIPVVGLVIGTAALIFQVAVLYPWHLELSRDFANLSRTIRKH